MIIEFEINGARLIISGENLTVNVSEDVDLTTHVSGQHSSRRPAKTLIESLGGNTKIAAYLGVGYSTVSEMKRRQAIPVKYWPALIRMAEEVGVEGIDSDALMASHTTKSEPAE